MAPSLPSALALVSAAASHDNLSHTLLGLADVTTSARRAELDSLQPCRL
jgi:glucan phosphoethanolaminetransferase (alkaline phosphatase superfamily)